MKSVVLVLFLSLTLTASSIEDKISNLIIIGFDGLKLPSDLKSFISNHKLGGVILFSKNIKNKEQLKALTNEIKKSSKYPIFIALDQEGGLVERLNEKNGFYDVPKPIDVAKLGVNCAKTIYQKMAKTLSQSGINLNFAPSVDLAINPKNKVIYGYGRSFGSDVDVVKKYADIFIDQMKREGVICAIKHYPGHGSSLKDSHDGFVDVTKTYQKREIEPFFKIKSQMIMTAHIYNANIDKIYPATLSKKTINLLRESGFDGVIVSDDLQMGAIKKRYDLNETISLALNAGVDMLLFGNQLQKPITIDKIIKYTINLVKSGKIDIDTLKEANRRVDRLKGEL